MHMLTHQINEQPMPCHAPVFQVRKLKPRELKQFGSWEVVQPEFQPQVCLALEPVPYPLHHVASQGFLVEEQREQA